MEFLQFLEYCRNLKFEEEPDYKKCLSFFEDCMTRLNLDPQDFNYTWKNKIAIEANEEEEKGMLADLERKEKKGSLNKDVERE